MLGTAIGAFAGVAAVQFMRLRRMEFLPAHPGFYVNHVVIPSQGDAGAERRRLRLVVLGDSTTAGVGVERAEDALPYLIARRVAEAEQRAVHVVSYGWAGARAADLARYQLPRAIEPLRATETESFLAGADLVAIVIGSNDTTHKTPPGTLSRQPARARSTVSAQLPRRRGSRWPGSRHSGARSGASSP